MTYVDPDLFCCPGSSGQLSHCNWRVCVFPFCSSNVINAVGDPGIAEKEDADSVFMEMICPLGTNPDDSPLYVLCCNDTCSFTWTGAEHINQVSPRPHRGPPTSDFKKFKK